MKRVYIAGAGGMLGSAFYEEFEPAFKLKCTDKDVNEDWLTYLDFRDFDRYREDVREFAPDYLFHLGALTDLEYCETHPDDAYATNAIAVENAVLIANELDIPVLYIGTAGIFDGKQDQYDDWDIPNPLGAYARAKWAGEQYVLQNARRYLICRAGWMMGGGPRKDKKFIQKMMSQIRQGKSELFVVDDKLGTPTYTRDFAHNTRMLLEKEFWGLYNMVCPGMTSRFDVAQTLVGELGLADQITVTPVDSNYFSETYFAPRPDCERLMNRKLQLRQLETMRPWQDALRHYLDTDYSGYLESSD
ncbi:MAG: NAD(P)-dependent oxidoreductase [Coriobacteriia bacterium]|nr:NAD(P)-dependent oxidoreductase [Coriobacteriia bacterium]